MANLKIAGLVLAGLGLMPCIISRAQVTNENTLVEGRRALMEGRIPDALSRLHSLTSKNLQDGQAHLLLCRTYYAERNVDEAVHECEAALHTMSRNSDAQNWMGRAYGAKAEHAGPLSGYGLAKKVKTAFETAVSLDPSNSEAIDDLGDYYLQAPSIVGGGLDKAIALAQSVSSRNREKALRLLALIAEKKKDFPAAEQGFREHVRVSNGRPDTWLDLAGFYQRRNQLDQAVDALRHVLAATHDKSSILVGVADLLNRMQREQATAVTALRDYLQGGNTDDSAPTFRARVMLGKMFAARGDKAAAKIEFTKALALAPDYEPAKKALASL